VVVERSRNVETPDSYQGQSLSISGERFREGSNMARGLKNDVERRYAERVAGYGLRITSYRFIYEVSVIERSRNAETPGLDTKCIIDSTG